MTHALGGGGCCIEESASPAWAVQFSLNQRRTHGLRPPPPPTPPLTLHNLALHFMMLVGGVLDLISCSGAKVIAKKLLPRFENRSLGF